MENPKIYAQLKEVQTALKAPKLKFNNFGNYKYRDLESILEAVKPLLNENDLTLTLFDEVVMIGNRFYVKACAQLVNFEGERITHYAYAREEEVKKGMDGAQITGTASSYARKYALNGLFLIDDSREADEQKPAETKKVLSADRFDKMVKQIEAGKFSAKKAKELFVLSPAQNDILDNLNPKA